ncbi:MAG TPA: right-handed parallel beta-helix repeat-containing protein [Acidimicrobiales bacterium]|nr:right-handed parallel beta-helix repeat-containing protein [Acidimicrobiales bacterium]
MTPLRKCGTLLAAALAATLPTIGGAAAQVSPPACGQTITQSTTLTADLGPCPNFGLIIGADGITLDLGGFRIFGTPNRFDNAGVYALGRFGVTVRNGTVSDFDGGVAIEGGSGNLVTGIRARDNIGVTGTRWGDGIALLSSTDNLVRGNEAYNNGPFGGIGVYSEVDNDHPRTTTGVSTRNLIEQNSSHDNIVTRAGVVNFASTENDGIRLEPGSVGNTVSNNQFFNNGFDGIAVFARSTDNIIRNNHTFQNGRRTTARRGDGIRVFATANRTTIEGNQAFNNGGNGIIVGSMSNTITFNRALFNGLLPPLNPNNVNTFTYDLNDQMANCDANVWSGNIYRTTRLTCSANGGTQV